MKIGDKLPEVLGHNEKGEEIRLSQFAGKKLIVYAYPKDNTSGCSAEACSLKQHYQELQEAGYAVVGISKDSAASHQKFIDKYELPFPLIADTDTSLLQTLGAWGEKNMYGKKVMGTLRTTYLVNETGVVEKIFTPKEIKTKIHAEQILDYIAKD
ncbi:MAG: peroxiredoxin [Bacteroidaceae bacterium]|nr:peroxiredoxin [Bacteroidaceae bacterium]